MVLVPRIYMHVEVFFYSNHPLLKALLIILPKHSLIESRQCIQWKVGEKEIV